MRPGIETDNGQETSWKHDGIHGVSIGGDQLRVHPPPSLPKEHGAWQTRQTCMIEKICLLGDSGVGKTSLVRRYTQDRFDFEYRTTSGAYVTPKKTKLNYREHGLLARWNLRIWDIPGKIRGETGAALFRGASGALVVGDAARLESQLDIWKWIEAFRAAAGNAPVIVVINKSDIIDRQEFDQRLVEDIAREYGCIYTMTSARNNDKVQEAFGRLLDFMARRRLIDGPEGAKAC